jgi:ABC-type branched-subunit amino acid transport system ATPase component
MLEVEGLTKSFGGVKAVANISLALEAGGMRAIIGPNGCGKTTLFNLITGYLQPDQGRISFNSRSMVGMALHQIARAGIVRKFQVPSIFPNLTVRENLRAAGVSEPSLLLEQMHLTAEADAEAATLAHGKKQWLEIAMTLAAKPKLLLLDEPVAGMTQAERTETITLLHDLRAKHGMAIMLIEHDMRFVEAMDCTVHVMDMGQIIATGTYDDVRDNARVREAYLGASHA